jgi:hypothetical protein
LGRHRLSGEEAEWRDTPEWINHCLNCTAPYCEGVCKEMGKYSKGVRKEMLKQDITRVYAYRPGLTYVEAAEAIGTTPGRVRYYRMRQYARKGE